MSKRLLPSEPAKRKEFPMGTGLIDYFPDALAYVSNISFNGNKQHNPGQPLHWSRGKSTDQSDTLMRHFVERGTLDTDGTRHSGKLVWRALALLQEELEKDCGFAAPRGTQVPDISHPLLSTHNPATDMRGRWLRGDQMDPVFYGAGPTGPKL